jgi:hypothetical protein
MDENLKIILGEFESMKGQFVITCSWEIVRLIAIGQDNIDYYYVTYDGRKLKWNTCVGRLMPLKGYLRDEDYQELVRLARLNHFDQIGLWGNKNPEETLAFNEQHKKEITTIKEPDEFLTEIFWDLV